MVNVHQLHLLIPTLLAFTNFTYYHAPKFLSTNSIESTVFGHGKVFVVLSAKTHSVFVCVSVYVRVRVCVCVCLCVYVCVTHAATNARGRAWVPLAD